VPFFEILDKVVMDGQNGSFLKPSVAEVPVATAELPEESANDDGVDLF
jgi:hypothetical protein